MDEQAGSAFPLPAGEGQGEGERLKWHETHRKVHAHRACVPGTAGNFLPTVSRIPGAAGSFPVVVTFFRSIF